VEGDLGKGEEVRHVAVGRLLGKPDAAEGLGGLAILTTDRVMLLPDAPGSPRDRASRAPLVDAFFELWSTVAGQMPGPTRKRAGLVTRARPGVDIPLAEVRDVFVSRVPRTIGFTLALPPPDPRPPWAIFLELPDSATARVWAETGSTLKSVAAPRPELLRPYALYYLTHPPPKPVVDVRGPEGTRRGGLRLGPDGPELGGHERQIVLPYEAIDRIEWADPTTFRRARLSLTAAERTYAIDPVSSRDAKQLAELARVLGETVGMGLDAAEGRVRATRIAFWATATASGVGAAIWEILLHL
jgi:hypothetical protein